MTTPTKDDMETIELMIDKYGLGEMTMALNVIAGDKADHLRANWQDKTSAKVWDRAATRLTAAARSIFDLGL